MNKKSKEHTAHEHGHPHLQAKKGKSRVKVKYDVGFENALFIRGEGGNLSWDRGQKLKNIAPDEWVWETDIPFTECQFKILINDKQYEAGDNHRLAGGTAVQYTPRF